MAKQANLYLPAGANNQSLKLTSADTTVATLCFTAGANDSNVKAIIVSTTDTVTVNLKLFVTRSSVDYLIGTVNVPLSSGNTGAIASVDLLNSTLIPGLPIDNTGKRYLPLKTGDTLKVGCLATMSGGGLTTTVNVFGEDY